MIEFVTTNRLVFAAIGGIAVMVIVLVIAICKIVKASDIDPEQYEW